MKPARRVVLAIAAAAPLALAACRVDGDADVRAVRSLLDAGLEAPPEPPAAGAALDLPTAFRLASTRSESLAETGEVYVRALVDRRRAAAAFLPTIDLVPAFIARENTSSDDGENRTFDAAAAASLDLASAVDIPEAARAEFAIVRERARLFAAQDDLLLDTGRALLLVVLFERRAEVLRGSLSVQQARVDDARGRVDAGVVRPLDVALAESRAADARVRIVANEKDARNARSALSYLVAWDVGDTRVDDTLPMPADLPSFDDLAATALTRRPEIAANDAAVDAARAALESASGQWWPSLRVDLDAFLTRDSQPTEQDWAAFVRLRIPVFTAGLIEADVREAMSRLREASLARTRTIREIRRSIEIARASYLAESRRLDALRVRLDAARRALDQADGLWTAGLGTNIERLIAQDDLLSVELEVVGAEQERRLRRLDLLRATGTLHETAGLVRPDPRTDPEEDDRAEAR